MVNLYSCTSRSRRMYRSAVPSSIPPSLSQLSRVTLCVRWRYDLSRLCANTRARPPPLLPGNVLIASLSSPSPSTTTHAHLTSFICIILHFPPSPLRRVTTTTPQTDRIGINRYSNRNGADYIKAEDLRGLQLSFQRGSIYPLSDCLHSISR